MRLKFILILLVCVCIASTAVLVTQKVPEPIQIICGKNVYPVYPKTYSALPEIPSPHTTPDRAQVVTALQKDGKFVIVPVTLENAPLTIQYGSRKIGKGKQLVVDGNDFPTLAKTGLHSERELDQTTTITGKPIEEITRIGRPEMSSRIGFMAEDEDIISVLRGDNRLVQRLGLTHSKMAKPLFHVWNLILKEYELGRIGRSWDNIQYVLYKGKHIRFGETHPTKGFQESMFNDEITGTFQITFYRELDKEEEALLKEKYSDLSKQQMAELIKRLSHMMIGEMEPYYIMRYGFYEGHTDYRADPIAVVFIFGLRSLEEIEAAFPGKLYEMLTMHFTEQSLPSALHLSMEEVLQLADRFAAEVRAQYEKFDLKLYPNRTAKYDPKMKKWVVHYMRRPNRWPGDHFSILVDDSTRELKYIGGA
jgi:hypothetical protein